MSKRLVPVISLFVVLALVLGACGGGSAAPTAAPAAVLAADTPTPVPPTEAPAATEAPVAEAPAAEAPAEEAPAAEGADLTAVVGDFAAGIPEGWMNTGKIDDVKAAIDAGAYVIDVREASEYEAGHIPGAVNIPIRTLAQNLDKVPADQPVLVYCASGHRAGMATAALRELGYDNVKAFSGGWKAWSGERGSLQRRGRAGQLHCQGSRPRAAGRGRWLPGQHSRGLLQSGHCRKTARGSGCRRRADRRPRRG